MIPQSYIDYYGDQTRWFIGVVIDINDPYALGRVKVRIFGIHSANTADIPDKDLPWAQTVIPITEGGSSGTGATVGIQVKAQVFGIFLDGKSSQLPLVLGSIPKFETGSPQYLIATNSGKGNKVVLKDGKEVAATNNPDATLMRGNSNIERAYNFFISEEGGRYTPMQTSAILGNFLQESGVRGDITPSRISGANLPGVGSIGIAQWNPAAAADARAVKLKEFAAARSLPWDCVYAQVQFTKYELETISYLGRKQLVAAKDIDEATTEFCNRFERPNKKYAHLDKRKAYAREILGKFR